MISRKLYLKIRIYLYSIRHVITNVLTILLVIICGYIFLDTVIVGQFIMNKANNDAIDKNCKSAIPYYNMAYLFYNFFNFTEQDKYNYMEISYKKAMCYLKTNKKADSIGTMVLGLSNIEKKYGVFSRENAYFIRKYLIEYYLTNNKSKLAMNEFNNLLQIYKVIGYKDYEMADLTRISGDLYYQQKQYDIAMDFYKKAYDSISKQSNIDYEVFSKIVKRIATYEIQNQKTDVALGIYKSSIDVLLNSPVKNSEITAQMLLDLANLSASGDPPNLPEAEIRYEQALEIIRKLPSTNYLKLNIIEYYKTLKDFYTTSGKTQKADEIQDAITRHERFRFLY